MSAAGRGVADRRTLGSYLALTFGWTWGWWILSMALTGIGVLQGLGSTAVSTIGDLGPLLVAWLMVARAGGISAGWRFLRNCLRIGGPVAAWIVGTAVVLAIVATASAAQHRWGGGTAASLPWVLVLPQLVVMLIVGGGQEEFGWRGWLQPRMVARYGRLGVLAVGVIWFTWHLPLWWVPGSVQSMVPIPAFAGFTIGFSMLVWRIQEATDGRPSVAIWLHAVTNTAGVALPFIAVTPGGSQVGVWVLAGLHLAVGVGAMCWPRRAGVPPAIL